MIVATAGHVDHGKTSLVKALTEIDTDTLAEERRRGMTIDIGFAFADFGLAMPIGFVDLPGHERFIRNLLAGVAAVDLALLVVAADDGPMPQSREHLAILTLLGVPRLTVVLTKIDRVSAQRLAEAERETSELLAAGPFCGAPVYPVVATTGIGVPALRAHLAGVGRSLPARATGGQFRLAVDRSFTLPGAGRIVTGAAMSGSVRVGDRLIVSPAGGSARVRGLRAHDQPVDQAFAGQRCALNLVGSELRGAEPARGDWVVAPPAHAPSDRLDVRLEVVAGAERPLVDRSALLLHIGAAAVPARVALLFASTIPVGESGLAQLVLARPVAALHGDRFILRDAAAGRILAGGRVIDPFAPARGRSKPARAAVLAALAKPAPIEALAGMLTDAPLGIDLDSFALARNLTSDEADRLFQALAVELLHVGTGRWGVAATHWKALRQRIGSALQDWHASQADSVGPSEAALAGRLGLRAAEPTVSPAVLHAALGSLVADGSVAREGLRCRLAGHRPLLSAADSRLLARVTALLAPAGLRPPIVGELAALLSLSPTEVLDFLTRASRLGALVPVAGNRYFLPETVEELAAQARRLASASADGRFDAAAYRDRTGIGRNLTVQVLEFLDREGVTRFDGAQRSLVDPGGRSCRVAEEGGVDDPEASAGQRTPPAFSLLS